MNKLVSSNRDSLTGEKLLTLIFAAGGTGGHIYPALTVAEAVRKKRPSARILFCGTETGMESRLIPQAGFDFCLVEAKGFPVRPGRRMVEAYQAYRRGRRTAVDLIKTYQPDAVIGTGGYVCGPLLSAAAALKVPRLIHEQNAMPGRSNRLMSVGAELVCTGYPDTERYFKWAKRVLWTGNPVRDIFYRLDRKEARHQLGLPADRPMILAVGGSLGARRINEGVVDLLRLHPELEADVILATGEGLLEDTKNYASGLTDGRLAIYPYLKDLYLYMAAADLVICRAGAGTCAELGALKRAAILVPYPYAAHDHQRFNALAYSEKGAAVYCANEDCTGDRLADLVIPLMKERERLQELEKNLQAITAPPATRQIVDALFDLVSEGREQADQ